MPELPDVTVYVERLRAFVVGDPLERIHVVSPSLLRTFKPRISEAEGRAVESVGRVGKRIVITLEGALHLVIHLMVAGRLRWRKRGARPPRKNGLAAFDFPRGTIVFTEASTRKRASLHLVAGDADLRAFDRGGLDVFECTAEAFSERLRSENHTLKRALTDPRMLDGIGGAYGDEIMHRAKLSPIKLTSKVTDGEYRTLLSACRDVLTEWCDRLRERVGEGFPDKVTAFHPEMAVHGRFGEACPVCDAPVQRIVYASNETNYCPTCQTEGKLLADRALSRLLKDDWPRSLEEVEERRGRSRDES